LAHAVASTGTDTLHCIQTISKTRIFVFLNATASLVKKIGLGRGSNMLMNCTECFQVQPESGNGRYKYRRNHPVLAKDKRKIRRIQ